MKKKFLLAVGVLLLFSMIFPEKGDYIGIILCKRCHRGEKNGRIYEIWKESRHAKAFKTLKEIGEDKNPKCLQCHTTAFNEGGYKLGDFNASTFENVNCEACHGPGSMFLRIDMDEKLDQKKQHFSPTEETCKKCHNKKSPTFKGFNFKEAIAKIEHKVPKKENK